jgi:hypothetical protein
MTEPVARRLRRLGLVRAVVRRSRSDWPLVLAAWLLLACATSLITAAATYSESVSLGGFRGVIEASPASSSAVRVYATVAASAIETEDGAVAPNVGEVLGSFPGRACGAWT